MTSSPQSGCFRYNIYLNVYFKFFNFTYYIYSLQIFKSSPEVAAWNYGTEFKSYFVVLGIGTVCYDPTVPI